MELTVTIGGETILQKSNLTSSEEVVVHPNNIGTSNVMVLRDEDDAAVWSLPQEHYDAATDHPNGLLIVGGMKIEIVS